MKKQHPILICLLLAGTSLIFAQSSSETEAQMRFLASDALQGRRTGSPGNDAAAAFIAAHLQANGYQTAPGLQNYYQPVPLESMTPPTTAKLSVGKTMLTQGQDFLILGGGVLDAEAQVVFAGHGWIDAATGLDDYKGLDVKGKIVVVLPGTAESSDPRTLFRTMKEKPKLAAERGAIALIELYRLSFPWAMFTGFFKGGSVQLAGEENTSELVYAWLKEPDKEFINQFQKNKKAKMKLSSSGFQRKKLQSNNVIGILEGTDPVLKNEYMLLSAHYDHVGTASQNNAPAAEGDTIFNGARDNAMGVVALLNAAKDFAQNPPRRSVIILAVTGEELGLLGSEYYAQHPSIPLEKTIFNLNTDGAGYNDTSVVSVIGFGRTGTDDFINAAAASAHLGVVPNPAPKQNLFDRSDNVSFARKGVPALCFSPGMRDFDDAIGKYYHQPADEADSIDFPYLSRFCVAFSQCAQLIANNPERPKWKTGDKYEEAGKTLYGSKP